MTDRGTSKRDEAATRRRWVSLAETVAIAGVFIAGLTLYLSWVEKREDRADQAAAKQEQTRVGNVVTLRATREKAGNRLVLADSAHSIDSIDVTFPSKLGVQPHEAILTTAIEADWVKGEMLSLTDGGKDKASGKLPVLIASTFWDGETKRTDHAIYDIVWKTDGQFLGGRAFKLEGLVLRERGGDQRRLDAIWTQDAPKPAK